MFAVILACKAVSSAVKAVAFVVNLACNAVSSLFKAVTLLVIAVLRSAPSKDSLPTDKLDNDN